MEIGQDQLEHIVMIHMKPMEFQVLYLHERQPHMLISLQERGRQRQPKIEKPQHHRCNSQSNKAVGVFFLIGLPGGVQQLPHPPLFKGTKFLVKSPTTATIHHWEKSFSSLLLLRFSTKSTRIVFKHYRRQGSEGESFN